MFWKCGVMPLHLQPRQWIRGQTRCNYTHLDEGLATGLASGLEPPPPVCSGRAAQPGAMTCLQQAQTSSSARYLEQTEEIYIHLSCSSSLREHLNLNWNTWVLLLCTIFSRQHIIRVLAYQLIGRGRNVTHPWCTIGIIYHREHC